MKQCKVYIITVLLLLAGIALYAEINPVEYARMQNSAPEQLLIRTLRVSVKRQTLFSSTKIVTLNARVEQVHQSQSQLSTGDTITIEYTTFKPGQGWVGPRPIPILKKGVEYHAFLYLDKERTLYVPAARGYSFSSKLPLE